MNSFYDFVKDWGYWAVFFGAIVEGEVVILTASALAFYKYLSIYYVFLISFLTTVIVDQGLFWIGYKMGTEWITKKFKKVTKVRDKVFNLLYKMDALFIFSFRFIYGIRMTSPLIIGSARVNPYRFAFYNTLSGLTWAFITCFVGYVVADVVIDGRLDSMPYVNLIVILFIIIALAIGIGIKFKKANRSTPDTPDK
ncbi:MAG: VTT domain-containing protein [Puniceicoccales bacterium]|jgi:membrane protein DedA with SNARE-associated domain|nr:VTT domain-containing protein [Puniceicoccales bacterium]